MAILEQIRTMSGTDGRPWLNNDKHSYVAVHVRSLKGSCYARLGDLVPADECSMSRSYIKRILRSKSLLGRIPVVVISDMETPEAIAALENDEELQRKDNAKRHDDCCTAISLLGFGLARWLV